VKPGLRTHWFPLVSILLLTVIACSLFNAPIPDSAPGETPDDAGSLEEPPVPPASTDEITISSRTAFLDQSGSRVIHGVMTNGSDAAVALVELHVSGPAGSWEEQVLTVPFGLAPSDSFPFRIPLPESAAGVDQAEISVRNLQQAALDPVSLEILDSTLYTAPNGIVTLTAELANPSAGRAEIPAVEAALFDSGGELVTTAACQVCPRAAAPGGKVPVRFFFYGHPADPVPEDFEIYFSGVLNTQLEEHEITVSEPVHVYTDQSGWVHVLGEIRNDSAAILDLTLLGTFYDSDGKPVAAAAANPALRSLEPGAGCPFEFRFPEPGEAIDSWLIQVDAGFSRVVDTPSFELSGTGEQVKPAEYQWSFSGSAVNDSGSALEVVLVVAGLRDSGSGALVGLARTLIRGELAPGSSVEYNLAVTPDPAFDPAGLEAFTILRGRYNPWLFCNAGSCGRSGGPAGVHHPARPVKSVVIL